MSPPLKNPNSAAEIEIAPDPDSPPQKSLSSSGFLWSNLFSSSSSATTPSSSPSFLPDGTPVVLAPSSVILNASSTWAGHLLCRFLGEPPSPVKFYNDLNRVWGKFGNISVRRFSSGVFLVHVPSASTRKWILQTGLWSSGTVSFIVSEWSVNPSLASPPKLTSATTVLTIRDIPPQLWSHEAVARIAGGVAKLIPGTRASLPLSSLGTASIRAIVPLGSPLPPSVLVKDVHGDSVLVSIEYGKLPHLCSICKSYGHQMHRCPLRPSATNPLPAKLNSTSRKNTESDSTPSLTPEPELLKESMVLKCHNPYPSSSLEKSPLQASEVADQAMDLDTSDGNKLVLKTDSQQDLSSIHTSVLDPKEPSACSDDVMEEVCPSPSVSEPIKLHSSPQVQYPSTTSSSLNMEAAHSLGVPESMVDISTSLVNNTIQTCSSDSSPVLRDSFVPDTTLPLATLSPEDGTKSPLLPANSSDATDTRLEEVPLLTSSMDNLMKIDSLDAIDSAEVLNESLTHLDHGHNIHSSDDQTKFDFPPPPSCGLNSVNDTRPSLDNVPIHLHKASHLMEKKESIKVKRKAKSEVTVSSQGERKASLRCTQLKHQFKPQGASEKRRKKISYDCIPSDDEVQQCILELQSDKDNTLHYEVLHAYKVLQNIKSDTHQSAKT